MPSSEALAKRLSIALKPSNSNCPSRFLRAGRGFFLFAVLRRFSRLRCASTIPRCKGCVATRLRRRERACARHGYSLPIFAPQPGQYCRFQSNSFLNTQVHRVHRNPAFGVRIVPNPCPSGSTQSVSSHRACTTGATSAAGVAATISIAAAPSEPLSHFVSITFFTTTLRSMQSIVSPPQKFHVSRSGTNSMMVSLGTGPHGSPSKALPCFVQMSAGLLRRGSTST